jgi:hypothetical protein
MTLRAARRLLLSLSLPALLAACSEQAVPPAPAPAAATAPAPSTAVAPTAGPAVAVAPAGGSLVLHYSTDEATIGSEVGERRLGAGTSTTGRAGWLLFGPYAALPAGRYRVELQGFAEPDNAGTVHVDVARDKGATVVAAVELDAAQLADAASEDGWVVLPFTLAGPATDIEVRVRVVEASRLSVSGYVIRAVP